MKADAFFAEIGASGYTDAYRARAARAAGPAERAGATDGRAVEPGATVRAAG
jgi:hypothetical protein